MMKISDQIEGIFPTLPRQERKVAMIAVQKPEQVQQMSISELASQASVSNATITRFVKRLGCGNFASFKISLARGDDEEAEPKTDESDATANVLDFYGKVLRKTRQKLNAEELRQAVDWIKASHRVYLFGIGSSGYSADEFNQRLMRMGIYSTAMTESQIMAMIGSLTGPDDLVIALSNSGRTLAVNEAVNLVRNQGARVISITSYPDSPLTKLSDLSLLVQNTRFIDNSYFINSQFSIMYVIDILTTLLAQDERFSQKMSRTIDMVEDKRLSSFGGN
ncbi:MurR/RpiR family transcriptional regulator [Limosilactobacillus difficilis]|uniref:MurR/RpiR family transcriptional regulator n=1 Tax=Limosilactobacillus difficilis TaxID=2991838 RepID=UPI0024B98A32|nr:MurR/RpiR family transcriptional regulator [Limosilactobacillus difficilis]